MTEIKDYVAVCLFENLQTLGVPINKEAQGLRIGQGTPIIKVQEATVWEGSRKGSWLSHIDIAFALNPDRPETILNDCASGWGDSPEDALVIAVNALCQTTVPPIFSLLNSESRLGASFFPPNDPSGFPDREVISSQYIFRGDQPAIDLFVENLRHEPLLSRVVDMVTEQLDRPLLNTLKLYVGFDGQNFHADCRLNDKPYDKGIEVLLHSNLPKLNQFVSVSQFMLLLSKPPSA